MNDPMGGQMVWKNLNNEQTQFDLYWIWLLGLSLVNFYRRAQRRNIYETETYFHRSSYDGKKWVVITNSTAAHYTIFHQSKYHSTKFYFTVHFLCKCLTLNQIFNVWYKTNSSNFSQRLFCCIKDHRYYWEKPMTLKWTS